MQDEKKLTTSPSPIPIVDTGSAGNLPVLSGKEALKPISISTGELPPVEVLKGVPIEVKELPSDQIQVEGITDQPKKIEIKDSSSAPLGEQSQPIVSPPPVSPKSAKKEEFDHANDSGWGMHEVTEREEDREELEKAA